MTTRAAYLISSYLTLACICFAVYIDITDQKHLYNPLAFVFFPAIAVMVLTHRRMMLDRRTARRQDKDTPDEY